MRSTQSCLLNVLGRLLPQISIMLALSALADAGRATHLETQKQVQKPIAELNFEIVNGRIYIPGKLNSHPIWIILDSGAGPSTVDSGLAESWKLKTYGRVTIDGTGQKPVYGKQVEGASATFAGITIPVTFAIPLDSLSNLEGRHVQAIIGHDLFKEHIVEIDYARQHIRIFGKNVQMPPLGTAVSIKLVDRVPIIPTSLLINGKQFKVGTLIDTGARSSSMTMKFLKDHPLKVASSERTITGAGLGGMTYGRIFRPESLTVGSVTLQNPSVDLTEAKKGALGADSDFEFLAGADILHRFTITFDYPHKRIFLDPNTDLFEPFEEEKTGMVIDAYGEEFSLFKVVYVMKGSAADVAGIRAGDSVDAIDGKPAASYSLYKLRLLFKESGVKGWDLRLKRGGKDINVSLAAKSII